MTEDQKNALREQLYSKPIRELVELVVQAMEEVQEAKEIRRTLNQIRNLCTPKDERKPQGRPRKQEKD